MNPSRSVSRPFGIYRAGGRWFQTIIGCLSGTKAWTDVLGILWGQILVALDILVRFPRRRTHGCGQKCPRSILRWYLFLKNLRCAPGQVWKHATSSGVVRTSSVCITRALYLAETQVRIALSTQPEELARAQRRTVGVGTGCACHHGVGTGDVGGWWRRGADTNPPRQ